MFKTIMFNNVGKNVSVNAKRQFANIKRPLSPHLTIYEPQLTWLMSITSRITGAFHSTLLYGTGILFAYASLSASTPASLYTKTVDGAQKLSNTSTLAVKTALAVPFVFHCANGVRHLVWDTGRALGLRAVYAGGWAVNVVSVVGGVLLALV